MDCKSCGKVSIGEGRYCPHCGERAVELPAVGENLERLRTTSLECLERGEWDAALKAAGEWYRMALFSIEAGRFLEHVEVTVATGMGRDPGTGTAPENGSTKTPREPGRDEIERLTRSAEEAESREQWKEAIGYYDSILSIAPGDLEMEGRRAKARGRLRTSLQPLFEKARKAEASREQVEAALVYEQLGKLLPWDVEPIHGWERVRVASNRSRETRPGHGKRRQSPIWPAWLAVAAVTIIIASLATVAMIRADFLKDLLAVAPAAADMAGRPSGSPVPVDDSSDFTATQAAAAGLVVLDAGWRHPGAVGMRNTLEIEGETIAFRWIPPGTAVIGSAEYDPCRDDDERQWTARFTSGFWMAETEVTQAQWIAIMSEQPDVDDPCPQCPVRRVSWFGARSFVESLNAMIYGGTFRLPTEAEWEYAARSGSPGPFGNNCRHYDAVACDDGNHAGIGGFSWNRANAPDGKVREVALRAPNAWGLFDMHGNVSEWCRDWYGEYPAGIVTDYRGPARGVRRVQRGGGIQQPRFLRAANRAAVSPSYRLGEHTGFRIVLEIGS